MTLTSSTSAHAFAATKIGQSSDHQLTLNNSSEEGSFAFRIDDDTFGLFSIIPSTKRAGDVQIGNGESISLTIRFSPTHLLGGPEFTATLVATSGGVDTGFRVDLTGTVQECVLVTPASIDFGSVEVGNSVVKFSVTNQTYADVQLELPTNSRGLSLVGLRVQAVPVPLWCFFLLLLRLLRLCRIPA